MHVILTNIVFQGFLIIHVQLSNMRDISMYRNVLIYPDVSNCKEITLMKNIGLVYQGYLTPYQITKQ